MTTQLQTIPL